MASAGVWILGGYQSDFARNLTREGHDFANLTSEVVDFTLAGTGDRRSARGTAEIIRSVFRVGGSDDGMGIAPRVNVSFNFDARARASGGR